MSVRYIRSKAQRHFHFCQTVSEYLRNKFSFIREGSGTIDLVAHFRYVLDCLGRSTLYLNFHLPQPASKGLKDRHFSVHRDLSWEKGQPHFLPLYIPFTDNEEEHAWLILSNALKIFIIVSRWCIQLSTMFKNKHKATREGQRQFLLANRTPVCIQPKQFLSHCKRDKSTEYCSLVWYYFTWTRS